MKTIFSRLFTKNGILIVQLKLFLNLMLKEVVPSKQMSVIMHKILPVLVSSNYQFTELEDYFVDFPENMECNTARLKFMNNITSPHVPNFYDEELNMKNMCTSNIPDYDILSLVEDNIKQKFLNNTSVNKTISVQYFYADFRAQNTLIKLEEYLETGEVAN